VYEEKDWSMLAADLDHFLFPYIAKCVGGQILEISWAELRSFRFLVFKPPLEYESEPWK
jgi:hypothetical protein